MIGLPVHAISLSYNAGPINEVFQDKSRLLARMAWLIQKFRKAAGFEGGQIDIDIVVP
jgi:hypothetical protein